MKTINLVDLEKSEIKYKISNFPDGQQNIIIDRIDQLDCPIRNEEHILIPHAVQIKSRLNSFLDLELIICTVANLRELGIKEIHLYTPYFMGARSDRQFEEGGNRYLKDVICPIINSLKLESITVLDPHSSVLENLLNNFKKIDNRELVRFAYNDLYDIFPQNNDNIILVSPDAGASHKIYKLAEQIGYKGDIITCSKERDKDGKLSKTNVPFNLDYKHKDVIIVDDIFDFGGTFKNIALEIRKLPYFRGKLYLIVTHSIQTKGLKDALHYFDIIYTTNSYKNHGIEAVKQLSVF